MVLVSRFTQFLLSAHFTLGLILASFAGVIAIVFTTSPLGLGPAGMLFAFGIFYIWFLALFLGVAHVMRALTRKQDAKDEKHRLLPSRVLILVATWAFAPLILLALQSIGQLYLTSTGLVVLFELLATIYIMRR